MKNVRFQRIAFLLLITFFFACKRSSQQTPAKLSRVYYAPDKFVMGADLSYVNAVEAHGGLYKDSGVAKDPFLIFKNHGANLVRVRLWYNPSSWQASLNNGEIYSDLADVEKTIRRAKNAGLAVNLDFHYSDNWADPAKQSLPAAWNNLTLDVLKDSVYQYTLRVLNYLKSKNLVPDFLQVGNETNSGMLFPVGQVVNNNWIPFTTLLNSGIKAARDFSATSGIRPQIILHVAQLQNADNWTANIISNGTTDFDILGISHYHIWSTVKSMNEVGTVISSLKSKYHKKIMIVETAYPWTSQNADNYNNIISGTTGFDGYGVSKDEQYRFLRDLTQQIISGGGSGIMYWEPAWITSGLKDQWGTGSAWENNAFFDFTGITLPAIDFMNYPYKF